MITPYLWRSMLYVPANRPSRLQKCARYGADALILDLEDSVPDSEKAESRFLLKQALKEPIWDSAELYGSNGGSERVDLFVRINAMRTRYWREDLEAVIPEEIFGLKVPKVEEPAKVEELDHAISRIEKASGIEEGRTKLMLSIETAKGLLQLSAICAASARVIGVGFGSEDFMTDTGIDRDNLRYARMQMTLVVKAFGLYAQDSVYPAFSDLEGLKQETEEAKRMGMDGKTAIHPNQIETIHSVFQPSDALLEKAREICRMAEAENGRVFNYHGEMVDRPIVERYRRLLQRSREN